MTTAPRPFQHWAEDFDDTRPDHRGSITAACMRLNVTPTLLLKALRRARAAGWTGTYTDDTKRGK